MVRCSRLVIALLSLACSIQAYCCTSVIISGKARTDGRPVMLKHRDTGELNNRMQWFNGPSFNFIGLVNSSSKGGEVWAGHNSAGFCIMNTAAYDFKDDDVSAELMDKEGILMFEALGKCADLADFERMLDSLPKPWGVEANFGIIDAKGGAAYYEINNHSYKRYDVSEEPQGYMVVTNFTRSGRPSDRRGVDRFEKASEIMETIDVSTAGHKELFNGISRSGKPVMRDMTSSAIVFEGVQPGEDPGLTVAWTMVGCPTNCIYIPLKVFGSDHIPSFMKEYKDGDNAQLCSQALIMKGIYGFEKGCQEECKEVEEYVDNSFSKKMSPSRYDRFVRKVYRKYTLMYLRKLPKVIHSRAGI